MQIEAVYAPTNQIRILESAPFSWYAEPENTEIVPVCERLVTLTPREYDGHAVMAAYDQTTDTLYIKVAP